MKLATVIHEGYLKLRNNNIKSALLDSELLLADVLNESREFIILNSNNYIKKKEYDSFQEMITQRSKGKPISYLINKKFFWKYEFFVNEKVLIPRPDTEIIIEQVLRIYKKKK